jgi:hypothetical protein
LSDEEGSVMYVLDVDVLCFKVGLFRELTERLSHIDVSSRVTRIYAPRHLTPQVAESGALVEILPEGFDPARYVLAAAEIIGQGLVRFGPKVVAKMKTQTIAAALALRAGDPIETALRAALVSSIALKYLDTSLYEMFQREAQTLARG